MMPSYFRKLPLLLVLLFLLPGITANLFAQQSENNLLYGAETQVLYGGDRLPFWLYANTDGRVPQGAGSFLNRFYADYRSDEETTPIRYGGGISLAGRLSESGAPHALYLEQLYGSVGYGFLNLKAGRFYDPVGLNRGALTSGSMMMSRNATPFPKVQLETDGFIDVPHTRGHLQFKGMFANGVLEKDRFISNAFLHQKYFYLKVNYKMFSGHGGVIHQVMWGGTDPERGRLPSSLKDFFLVVTGQSASPDSRAPGEDIQNVIGNSIAAYDFRLDVDLESVELRAYRLFFLEDKVSTRFRSPWDGMWGLGAELAGDNNLVKEVLWEHINTKRQDSFDFEPRGTQTYYNHGAYPGGWSYEQRMMGNPLFAYGPNPNFVNTQVIPNNIIVAHHWGIRGNVLPDISYRMLFTYSRNYGEVSDQRVTDPPVPLSELRHDQYSALLQLDYDVWPEKNLSLSGALAVDRGELYEKSIGISVGIRWERNRNK